MLLVSFEGIDGSGKSTQVRLLHQHLESKGYAPLVVREPGGTEVSERIRTLLLNEDVDLDPVAELLLFSAARAQLCQEKIRPALDAGRIVICDRFYDSTTAYQGAGRATRSRGIDGEWLAELHHRATGGLVPDRTYLIDVDAEVALARRSEASAPLDRMETASRRFYRRVVEEYRRLAEEHAGRFVTLDGTLAVETLREEIQIDIRTLLHARAASH